MNEEKKEQLREIVAALMTEGKGLLAADESTSTAGKRLDMIGLPNEHEHRRAFREGLCTAPELERFISGVILYDETIKDSTSSDMPFPDLLAARGIIPGIKVDKSTEPFENFPDELATAGLDGLAERLEEYYMLGARFTKWRTVFHISPATPLPVIRYSAITMARYAAMAQKAGMVPIVEPEVLYDGEHTINDAARVTGDVLREVTEALVEYKVYLPGTIIKTSMVLAGKQRDEQSMPEEVADATLRTLHLSIPHDIGGIVFLSGGQSPTQATQNLAAVGAAGKQPWPISSSFSRALEEPFLKTWKGEDANIERAQEALVYRAKMNAAAQKGTYDAQSDSDIR